MNCCSVCLSNASRSSMPASQSQFLEEGEEMVPLQRVGVAVLGARRVGKTSLVSQFVYHDLQPPDVDDRSRYSTLLLGQLIAHWYCSRTLLEVILLFSCDITVFKLTALFMVRSFCSGFSERSLKLLHVAHLTNYYYYYYYYFIFFVNF